MWGLERGGTVAWLPAAVAHAVWTGGAQLLRGPLADALEELGFLNVGSDRSDRREGPDRNEVFASALCGARGPRALRELAKRHYVVVGCGGLGASVAVELAALGAQQLTLIDGDRVEPSNLNRLLWMAPAHVGNPKANTLADHLRSRFGAEVDAVRHDASAAFLDRRYGQDGPGASTWLLTVDRAPAARGVAGWLHGRCDVQYVHAGYVGSRCVAGPFVARAADPCPFCDSGSPRLEADGFIAPSAAPNNLLIASFLAAQLLLVAGAGPDATTLRGNRWVLDLRTGKPDVIPVPKRHDCEVCGIGH